MATKYLKYNNKLLSLNGNLLKMDVETTTTKQSEEKTVTPTTSQQIITPTTSDYELSKVTVNAIETETKTATANGDVEPSVGKFLSKVTVNVQPKLQTKIVAPSTGEQEITPDSSYDGLEKVIISRVTSGIDLNIKASNIKSGVTILGVTGTITPNDILNYAVTDATWADFVGTWEYEDATLDTKVVITVGETIGDFTAQQITISTGATADVGISSVTVTNGRLVLSYPTEYELPDTEFVLLTGSPRSIYTIDDLQNSRIYPYIKKI